MLSRYNTASDRSLAASLIMTRHRMLRVTHCPETMRIFCSRLPHDSHGTPQHSHLLRYEAIADANLLWATLHRMELMRRCMRRIRIVSIQCRVGFGHRGVFQGAEERVFSGRRTRAPVKLAAFIRAFLLRRRIDARSPVVPRPPRSTSSRIGGSAALCAHSTTSSSKRGPRGQPPHRLARPFFDRRWISLHLAPTRSNRAAVHSGRLVWRARRTGPDQRTVPFPAD